MDKYSSSTPSNSKSMFGTSQTRSKTPSRSTPISKTAGVSFKSSRDPKAQNQKTSLSQPMEPGKMNKNVFNLSKNFEKSINCINSENGCDFIGNKARTSSMDILELIKRRLDALKVLQMKNAILEAQFYEDLYLLECKYNKMYKSLSETRKRIIVGDYEPSDEDCKTIRIGENGDGQEVFKSFNEDIEKDREISKDLLAMSISNYAIKKGDFVKGIPEFWLSVLKRVGLISQMIEPHDEPILKYLYDIGVDLQDKKPYYFSLKFHFFPNEYFSNELLTKTYEFKIELDSSDPYVFEAPETICSHGCKINWKRNKNVTKKPIGFDSSKDIDDKQMSFFNFFETAEFENKNGNRLTCEEEAELAIDYEIGYTFKEKVIPRAILYYMGEIDDDDDDEDQCDFDECDQDIDKPSQAELQETSSLKNRRTINLNKN